jgi:membrane-bound serine protease (ClpP class)
MTSREVAKNWTGSTLALLTIASEDLVRRLSTAVVAAVVLAVGTLGVVASGTANAASAPSPSRRGGVQIVKISGLLDPVLADFLEATIRQAEARGSIGVVLQVNSTGAVVSDARLRELAATLHGASMPIIAWVGPSGARAEGGMAQLLGTVTKVGVAPGSVIGKTGDRIVPEALQAPAFLAQQGRLHDGLMGADAAAASKVGIASKDALILRRVLLQIPGFRVKAAGGQSATALEFSQLSTTSGLMHTFASPAVAYLMFVIGLSRILFELYTAGVGIAGLVGAGALIFGCYGLGVLPIRPVAVALILVSMVAFAVDVQIGVPRAWTVIGSVVFAVGSLLLYQGLPVPWLATIGGIIAVVLFMVVGMPAMTRTRFSTPSIARGWLVGRTGLAVDALGPEGVVRIGEGLWAGRSVEGRIEPGAAVQVVGVDGVVLRVEVQG